VLTPIWGLRPHVGVDAVIPAFLVIVLGGVGSFWGAVVAGLARGHHRGVTGAYAAEWSIMSMYLLLVFVLTFRARGLLGRKSASRDDVLDPSPSGASPVPASRLSAWLTKPMLVTFAALASFPLWAESVGLYPYLGIEVAIWMIYALGYQPLARVHRLAVVRSRGVFWHRRLRVRPLPLKLWENPLTSLACAAAMGALFAAVVGALVAHRRGIYFALMTIACGQVFWFISIKAHSITGGEDGLLNIRRGDRRPRFCVGPPRGQRARSITSSSRVLFACTLFSVAPRAFAVREGAPGHPYERNPRASSSATRVAHEMVRVCAFRCVRRPRGRAARDIARERYPDVMSVHGSGSSYGDA
jgi:ABC-type branched-subunit amino acid transport system permease subunit